MRRAIPDRISSMTGTIVRPVDDVRRRSRTRIAY
jgi:hypothetical protein